MAVNLRRLGPEETRFDQPLHGIHIDLTEFSNGPMLAPCLTEVHVGDRTRNLIIAVLLTALDVAVVVWCGGVVWQALSIILWSRLLFFLLGAVWVLALARVWARALYGFQWEKRGRNISVPRSIVANPSGLRGDGDV